MPMIEAKVTMELPAEKKRRSQSGVWKGRQRDREARVLSDGQSC